MASNPRGPFRSRASISAAPARTVSLKRRVATPRRLRMSATSTSMAWMIWGRSRGRPSRQPHRGLRWHAGDHNPRTAFSVDHVPRLGHGGARRNAGTTATAAPNASRLLHARSPGLPSTPPDMMPRSDTKLPTNMRELHRVCKPTISHHCPQLRQTRVGEEHPRLRRCAAEAHQTALDQSPGQQAEASAGRPPGRPARSSAGIPRRRAGTSRRTC